MAKKKAAASKAKAEIIEAKFDPAEVARLRMAMDVAEASIRHMRDQMSGVLAWQRAHDDFHFGDRPWWAFWR